MAKANGNPKATHGTGTESLFIATEVFIFLLSLQKTWLIN
jgi:hypothetical protein